MQDEIGLSAKTISFNSSVICGAKGLSKVINVLNSALFIVFNFVNSFIIVIKVDTQVLNFISSISLETFFIALFIIFSVSFLYESPSINMFCKFQTLSKNLKHPLILSIDQFAAWSKGPINIS